MTTVGVDIELFERIRVHDQAALECLYDRHFQRIFRFVTQITRDPDETLEIVNDVFLVVWTSVSSFKGHSNPTSWMLGIAYRKALKSISRKKQWLQYSDDLESHENPETNSEAIDTADIKHELQSLIAMLNPNERAVVELTYYFGYSYDEISKILNCPRDTIKNRLYQARKRIKGFKLGHSNKEEAQRRDN